GRDLELVVQAPDLVAHLLAQVGVEVAEWLVEQQDVGLHHDGAGQRHALLLAARELGRVAVAQVTHAHHVEDAVDLVADLSTRQAADLEAEADVLGHRHVGPDRVRLEDHRHAALLRGQRAPGRGDRAPVQLDGALARVEKAGDHAQGGGLAAARRAEQRDELAARQRQRRAVHRREGAEAAGDLAQDQLAHAAALSLERRSMKSRPTSRKPIITRATVTMTRTSPMEARISKLPSSLLSNSSTESTWVPVV